MHRNSDYTEEERYSSDLGQRIHDQKVANKGLSLKIGNDIEYANHIERIIVERKYSPAAALEAIKSGKEKFRTRICVRTLYRYIDAGIFLKLTNQDLPIKGRKKRHIKRVRIQKRAAAGVSIENRPEEVAKRNTFGHWEMDTVKGKQRVSKSCLLVLTERKTRQEIIAKLPDQKAKSVVEAIDRIEKAWGQQFSKVFRSITVDNGLEFSDCEGLERSAIREGRRTLVFYCHPYSSYERGSNENNNRMIRRHIPKGEDIDQREEEEIAYIENWMNQYPREILGYRTSQELFEEELERLA